MAIYRIIKHNILWLIIMVVKTLVNLFAVVVAVVVS